MRRDLERWLARAVDLGTWQGLYLYEHRLAGHARCLSVTVLGA